MRKFRHEAFLLIPLKCSVAVLASSSEIITFVHAFNVVSSVAKSTGISCELSSIHRRTEILSVYRKLFLDVSSHLYMRLCPSIVGPSVIHSFKTCKTRAVDDRE